MTSRVSVVEVNGPLAGVTDRFRAVLAEQGYTSLSAANQLPYPLCQLDLECPFCLVEVRRGAGVARKRWSQPRKILHALPFN